MYLSNFVDTINDLLIEKGLMQLELAEKINVAPATISRYISGRQDPEIDIAIKIANYFNCTLDYLFGLEENNTEKKFRTRPEFKVRFKFLLEHFNMTIKEIQEKAGIAKTAMYYWRNGEREPSMDSIIKLAKCFKCSIDFVLGRVDFE